VARPILALLGILADALGYCAASHGHALEPGYLE